MTGTKQNQVLNLNYGFRFEECTVQEHSKNGPLQVTRGQQGGLYVRVKNLMITVSFLVDVGACGVCELVRHVTMI